MYVFVWFMYDYINIDEDAIIRNLPRLKCILTLASLVSWLHITCESMYTYYV